MRLSHTLVIVLAAALVVCTLTPCAEGARKSKAKKSTPLSPPSPSPGKKSKVVSVSLEEGLEKARRLAAVAGGSSDGLVRLSPDEYIELVHTGTRVYSAVVMFTVQAAARKCKPCELMWTPFWESGSGFTRNQLPAAMERLEAAGANGTAAVDALPVSDLPVFFVVIDYDSKQGDRLFGALALRGTPFIAFVHPDRSWTAPARLPRVPAREPWKSPTPWTEETTYDLRQMAPDTSVLSQWVTRHCGIEIDLSRPLPWFRMLLGISTVVGGLYFGHPYIEKVIPMRVVFFLAFLLGALYCFSGLVFCSIRKSTWSQAGQNGEIFVYPGQRHQLRAEAYIVGSLYAAAVLSGIALIFSPAKFASVAGSLSTVLILIGAAVLYLALAFVSGMFSGKMGGGYPAPLTRIGALFPSSWGYFEKYGEW